MSIRRATLTAAVLAASVVTSTATATAAPDTTTPPPVAFRANLVGDAVVTTLADGVFALTGDQQSVAVRDAAGQTLDALPLAFTLDGQRLPIRQQITDDGHTLRLVPDLAGLDRAVLKPVAAPLENQLAMNDLINAVSLGTSIGSLVGTAIGAVAGIGVGVALAGASCLVLTLGCVVTVLPIISLVGAAGGLAGLVLAGGPTAVAAAFDYWTTLRAEPGQSKYAPQLQGKPGIPAPAASGN
ncbi:ammonium transporter [Nocardia niigatensis]